MVEINNQRKAFLDMLAYRGELDNGRQKTRNHGYDVIAGGEAIYWLLRSLPANLSRANPKLKSTGADATSFFPVGGMLNAGSLAWKTSSSKSDAVALQQIKERGAYSMIDRGDISSGTDCCSNIISLPGAGYGQFEHKADSLIAKFKEGRNGQRDWCGDMSHRDYLRSVHSYHRLPVMGC